MDPAPDTPAAPDLAAPAAPAPAEAPAAEAQAATSTSVQEGDAPDPSQTSQGLIEPYLNDLDPLTRARVEPILEKYRADQDARVNAEFQKRSERIRQYEQFGDPEQVAFATQVLNAFITDPTSTTEWLMTQAEKDLGVNVRDNLLAQVTDLAEKAAADPDVDPSTPLTVQDINRVLDDREKQRQVAAAQEVAAQQQRKAAIAQTQGWLDGALQRHTVPTESFTDGVKEMVLARAQSLLSQKIAADPQTAIDNAVAEFKQATSRVAPAASTPEPIVATGGGAPPAPGLDVNDDKSRREAMLNRLNALTGA